MGRELPGEVETIVVGAGSSGCVVATRASEDPARGVLLVEAGPDYGPGTPGTGDLANGRRNSMSAHDWGLWHTPRPGWVRLPFPRGRVVGGSSAVNTCLAVRGEREDFDRWAAYGVDGWGWDDVLPAFCAIERDLDFPDPWHGVAGPLPVRRERPSEWTPWAAAFLEAAALRGHPTTDDHNRPGSTGAGPHAKNCVDGVRISAAMAWLTPAVRARPNLQVAAGWHADRVLVEAGRAAGLVLRQGRRSVSVRARRVVLCAGAVMTPGVLLRSGVGPAGELRRLGVPIVADLPGVGARLLDHPGFAIFLRPQGDWHRSEVPLIQVALRYASDGAVMPNDMLVQPGASLAVPWSPVPLVSLMGHVGKPRGVGSIRWRSADPFARPEIVSRLLVDDVDRQRAVEAMQVLADLAATPALSRLARPVWPSAEVLRDRGALDAHLRFATDSGYHPCGTAPMGSDPLAVCDGRGRVRGVEGLYVSDASLMPEIPSGNIHLPTLMIGHRVGGWLRDGD